MNFYMPTQLFHEKDAVINHSCLLREYGTCALIVTGHHSAISSGARSNIIQALEKEGISYAIFNEIEENPSIETVEQAAAFGLSKKADFVIGIGGGSPLDAAKAIALLMGNPGKDGSVFYTEGAAKQKPVPVVAVPTTCGTGSEVTPYAILTSRVLKTKKSISYRIFPTAAFVDSRYLESASPSLIRNTAVDALAHLIESYINTNATDYTVMLCEYGLKIWSKSKNALERGRFSEEDHFNLMTASSLAGMAITHTGTSLPHGMSYHITYHKGTPHGQAVGIFLASYLDACPNERKITFLLQNLGFHTVKQFGCFIRLLIGNVSLSEQEMLGCVSELIANQAKLANCPYSVTKELAEAMYRDSLTILL